MKDIDKNPSTESSKVTIKKPEIKKRWWERSFYDSYYDDEDDDGTVYGYGSYGSSYFGGSYYKRSRYKSSLGWDSELGKTTSYYGHSYSYTSSGRGLSYYSKGDTDEKISETYYLLLKAIKATKDMVVILDFPFKLRLILDRNEDICGTSSSSATKINEKYLFIPTSVIDEKSLDDVSKINILCGIGIHEAIHLMYSEYYVMNGFKIKLKETFVGETLKEYNSRSIAAMLSNIIEDERVEDLLLKNRPGFKTFIDKVKDWNYSNYMKRIPTSVKNDKGFQLINSLAKLLRYQDKIDENDSNILNEYSDFIENNLSEIISRPIINTKDSCNKALDLVVELNNLAEIRNSVVDFSSYLSKLYDSIINSKDIKNEDFAEELCRNPNISSKLSTNPIISRLILGKSELGDSKGVYFTKVTGNKDKYLKDLKSVKHLIPGIKKIINQTDKNYKFNIYGCRSGLLDTNKLAEAYQGVPQVYVREGEIKTNKTTVCILVDESGSMGFNNKFVRARLAAILLNEALGSLPGIELFIYGHSADEVNRGSVDINIYKENSKDVNSLYSLSEITYRRENRDGTAILEVAKRVRKFTKNQCIMFVISDGEPCASGYWGDDAIEDVKKKRIEAEKLGFDVLQVSIDYVEGVDLMFDKYTDISKDLSELPLKLGTLVKKSVIENKKTVIV